MSPLYPLRLPPSFREKIWGRRDLSPWFPADEPPSPPIGEVWHSFEENRVANGPLAGFTVSSLVEKFGQRLMGSGYRPASLRRPSADKPVSERSARPWFPILSKILFTADRLSVQVHPDDEYAMSHHGAAGKSESWYVMAAEPGSRVALGLKERLSSGQLRRAAQSGEIVDCLHWVEAKPGENYFVPAGMPHALGPGLVICEIQRNSDLTYRFHDYGRLDSDGRPRPLQLDQAIAVTRFDARPMARSPFALSAAAKNVKRELLTACRFFAVERISWEQPCPFLPGGDSAELWVFIGGRGRIRAAERPGSPRGWSETYAPCDVFLLPGELAQFDAHPESPTVAIRAYTPQLPALQESLRRAGATPSQLGMLIDR